MTITQLQYVLAVAEHKNFTLAAEKCFVTQPTLSMQIQKIEEAISLYLEPNLNFSFTRKKVLERTNRGKLKQFKSYL